MWYTNIEKWQTKIKDTWTLCLVICYFELWIWYHIHPTDSKSVKKSLTTEEKESSVNSKWKTCHSLVKYLKAVLCFLVASANPKSKDWMKWLLYKLASKQNRSWMNMQQLLINAFAAHPTSFAISCIENALHTFCTTQQQLCTPGTMQAGQHSPLVTFGTSN